MGRKIEVETVHGLKFVEDGFEETETTAKIVTKPYTREKIAKALGVSIRKLNCFVKREKKNGTR